MLFGPAERTDFVDKFVRAGADIGVLDLEDATPESRKADARQVLADAMPGASPMGEMLLFVRTNARETDHFVADLEAAAAAKADGIVVPKVESANDVMAVRSAMAELGIGHLLVCGGIETVAGVHHAAEVATAGVDLVYFGAEDYITDLGGVRTAANTEVLYARSQVAIAARLGQVPALDQVVVDYGDSDRFAREAAVARSLGYAGKLCIHPSQVDLANAAFSPSEDELAWAHGVVAAAEAAELDGRGVVSYEGTMVDAPIINRARNLLGYVDS